MEQIIKLDLYRFLLARKEIHEILPDAPDIQDKWETIAQAYLPDGIREFSHYPTVSLGWMMYIGMAVAELWDKQWEAYADSSNIYEQLRDPRGYDCMDEYICQEILHLSKSKQKETEDMVAECASRTNATLRRSTIEPGTPEAFRAYVACLHQMYLMGAAVQLKRLKYKMQAL